MTEQQKTWFDNGDLVVYKYTHHLNSNASTTVYKNAVFVRKVKDKSKSVFEWNPNPKVVIHVNGNKHTSTVYMSEITHKTT